MENYKLFCSIRQRHSYSRSPRALLAYGNHFSRLELPGAEITSVNYIELRSESSECGSG